ncbi:hypothetical protein B0H12DRAFT_1109889 [Mycena haematopus]|nr:hypothetical protein B0H12DRAFT_1109889 [Mycena haematopus]
MAIGIPSTTCTLSWGILGDYYFVASSVKYQLSRFTPACAANIHGRSIQGKYARHTPVPDFNGLILRVRNFEGTFLHLCRL